MSQVSYTEDESHFEITKEITESANPVSLHSLHLWRMPELVAPRALVFRSLVKENEDSENEIGSVVERKGIMPF